MQEYGRTVCHDVINSKQTQKEASADVVALIAICTGIKVLNPFVLVNDIRQFPDG